MRNIQKNAPWLDDIGAAYSYLWENHGPFTAAGLDEQVRARVQADGVRASAARAITPSATRISIGVGA